MLPGVSPERNCPILALCRVNVFLLPSFPFFRSNKQVHNKNMWHSHHRLGVYGTAYRQRYILQQTKLDQKVQQHQREGQSHGQGQDRTKGRHDDSFTELGAENHKRSCLPIAPIASPYYHGPCSTMPTNRTSPDGGLKYAVLVSNMQHRASSHQEVIQTQMTCRMPCLCKLPETSTCVSKNQTCGCLGI